MKALGLVVLEKIFYVFPNDPRGGARMDPRGTVGRIYKEDHYTLLHTKYESSGPCGFRRRRFFKVFPMMPPGRQGSKCPSLPGFTHGFYPGKPGLGFKPYFGKMGT